MIREDKFLISRRPYAVDLDSLNVRHNLPWSEHSRETWHGTINAVWFRRRSGVTVACIGDLWCTCIVEPRNAEHFLELHTDGRYGGNTVGRWDGSGYWGLQVSLEKQNEHLKILQPMLENYPEIPAGHSGWWRF